ncbi:MAG: hypothetical protein BWY13_00213 [Euryarchaeota archaeon ADurb.Bin190]|nr:MAG: hypothetical protein A4E45_02120 [Methanosaeta sp. PtaB.Bin039]OQB27134.1 MAG: hypothetical protein BWY13_00213 [Euryarchaeota archaeon ADurb.Bin190]
MFYDIKHNFPQPGFGHGQCSSGGVSLLYLSPLLGGAIGKYAIEELLKRRPEYAEIRHTCLVEYLHSDTIGHRLVVVIAVDVATERLPGVPVFLEERSPGEPQEAGIGQSSPHVCGQGFVLTPVGLVGQDEDIGVVAQDGINCGRILELLDSGHDRLAHGIAKQLLQVLG